MEYICLDIGGTFIKYGVVNEQGEFLIDGKERNLRSDEHMRGVVCAMLDAMLAKFPGAGAICISTAGIVDSERGVIVWENEKIMPGLNGAEIGKELSERYHLPVIVENDVNCALLAEYYHGAAKGHRTALMLTVGTGIGGAYLQDGVLLKGHLNSACEIGQMRFGISSYEEIGSTDNMVRRLARRLARCESSVTCEWIFEEAAKGNEECLQELDYMCDTLAKGIANCILVLNPEVVIVGGGISVQQELLRPRLEQGLKRYLIPLIYEGTELKFAENGNKAGMLGAFYAFQMREKGIK